MKPLSATHPAFARTFSAGLFDLDGTLIDSTPAVERSWAILAQEFGVTEDVLATGHGQPAAQLIARHFPADRAEEALARIVHLETHDLDGVTAIRGAVEVLSAFGDRAAIVTSGTKIIAHSRVNAAGIRRPGAVVTFDDVTHGKPNPEPFLLGAERLGVSATDCVAFEDAPAGIAAANAAGCTTIGIAGTHDAAELKDADLVVAAIADVAIVEVTPGEFRVEVRG